MVETAVQQGVDPEARDPYSALAAHIDALPPDEQLEFIALHGDPREGQRIGRGAVGAGKPL